MLCAAVSAGAVLLPGESLVPVLVLTQVLNAALLLPLLVVMYRLARDPEVMNDATVGTCGPGGLSPGAGDDRAGMARP